MNTEEGTVLLESDNINMSSVSNARNIAYVNAF